MLDPVMFLFLYGFGNPVAIRQAPIPRFPVAARKPRGSVGNHGCRLRLLVSVSRATDTGQLLLMSDRLDSPLD
jgi:hypothetical protein